MDSWIHEFGVSENKSRSEYIFSSYQIQSNVSETRAADGTCQGLQLRLKEKGEKEAVWAGRYQCPWLISGLS